jgi:hypothetical protein
MLIPPRVVMYILLCGFAFYLVMSYLVRRRKNTTFSQDTTKRAVRPAHKLRADLVSACFNDAAAADRLVEYEHKLSPGVSTQVAVTRALDRLGRDRGGRSKVENATYNPKDFRGSKGPSPQQDDLAALVRACRGDSGTAKGLVELELKRHPGITRADAIERAIDRLSYDRGR